MEGYPRGDHKKVIAEREIQGQTCGVCQNLEVMVKRRRDWEEKISINLVLCKPTKVNI